MCGFAGWWQPEARTAREEGLARLRKMLAPLVPRGPDEEGLWFDPEAGIALGFRRLAILDLTSAGHQPMVSHDGRFELVFNGEIYNHLELRRELESSGTRFRGRSDTEVLLEAIGHWGLTGTLPRLNGMFALALWDSKDRCLRLARDRFGKKPLCYGWAGGSFLFGSTFHALRAHPDFQSALDPSAIAAYLRFCYVPGPHAIFAGFHKLLPGTYLELREPTRGGLPSPIPYWDARQAALAARASAPTLSIEEAENRLESLLLDAVRLRTIADVPLGAFLSGGIDSSLVVALMQKLGGPPVKTFSIGFPQKALDEAPYARAVANHLGTDHTEMYLEAQQALGVVPLLPAIFDEPFADSSQIPTFLVSKLVRDQVTVALSGDAGDELFAGYERYFVAQALLRKFGWIPGPLRQGLALTCEHFPSGLWDATVTSALGRRYGSARLRKLGRALNPQSFMGTYREMVSYWSDTGEIMPGVQAALGVFEEDMRELEGLEPIHQMMLTDTRSYLVDDILVKVDRSSMANSLEVRNPFLDTRIFDLAWSLPLEHKWQPSNAKRILKRVLYRHVPRELVDRPKMGFGIPLRDWLRGPLREWAEDLLSPRSLALNGLDPGPVRQAWNGLLAGRVASENLLWPIIVLQQWVRSSDAGSHHG
ncbi:MAG: asparagine synthase (glutamine-hydrolyzing) [Geothrix sp.]|nr:asparagine synthase (glutamine-hydrolyzing) [Geothrix sp.]